jgi:hypothetical protein
MEREFLVAVSVVLRATANSLRNPLKNWKRRVLRTLVTTTTYGGAFIMRLLALAALVAISSVTGPAIAQQTTPSQSLQNEADKGIKTQNSGASGYVGEQDKPGSASHMPGDANRADTSGTASTAPSAQNSGAGISGAPGGKNGPSQQGTVGSASQNLSVQEQDPANVKGLPGNKSGPPAKR